MSAASAIMESTSHFPSFGTCPVHISCRETCTLRRKDDGAWKPLVGGLQAQVNSLSRELVRHRDLQTPVLQPSVMGGMSGPRLPQQPAAVHIGNQAQPQLSL
jgi:hypothetical protein